MPRPKKRPYLNAGEHEAIRTHVGDREIAIVIAGPLVRVLDLDPDLWPRARTIATASIDPEPPARRRDAYLEAWHRDHPQPATRPADAIQATPNAATAGPRPADASGPPGESSVTQTEEVNDAE